MISNIKCYQSKEKGENQDEIGDDDDDDDDDQLFQVKTKQLI